MNKTEVMTMLKENTNPRGVEHWKKLGPKTGKLKSFGIGLTVLRKLAKQVGRDHQLAGQLWKSKVYDAKVIGLLIDEPKKVTREQTEAQVEDLNAGMLMHIFSSCDATLAKTPFAKELALDWINADDIRKRCARGLMYEFSKDYSKKAPDENFFMEQIALIEETCNDQGVWVRESMNGALLGIGKRTKNLNKAAIEAVKIMGPTGVDYGPDNSCESVNVIKHLSSDYIKQKLFS